MSPGIPKSRSFRSQGTHRARNPGNAGGAKGCREVETRCPRPRRKPSSARRANPTERPGPHDREGATAALAARLLTALDRQGARSHALFAKQRFWLGTDHDGPSILVEVRPPTGEPDAGNPPVRFGGGRDRTRSVLPTPIRILPIWAHEPEPYRLSAASGSPVALWAALMASVAASIRATSAGTWAASISASFSRIAWRTPGRGQEA